MKIEIKRLNDEYLFEASNETGNKMLMDASKDIGGGESAFRPMQLLLSAIGGCSAIDVVLILKKQKQVVEDFEIVVEGEREKIGEYSLFNKINLHFILKGNIDEAKAERAVKLSLEKYCSVAKTLEPTAIITSSLTIKK